MAGRQLLGAGPPKRGSATAPARGTRVAKLAADVSGSKMTRERSLRLARLGASERDLLFRVGGEQVYRVPSLLHVLLNHIIFECVVNRRHHDVHELMRFMPYRSFVQRKFFDELERQGFITSAAFRKFLPENNWMQGCGQVLMAGMGLGAPDLYLLRFCLETVDYDKVDLRNNPLTGPAVVCIGPIVGAKLVTYVDISNTAIGPVGAETLATSLHEAPLLQVLKLRGCSLIHTSKGEQVTEGVGKLLRSLGELPNLLDVDLSDNGLFGARWDKYSLAWVGTLCHEVVGAFAQFLRRNDSLVALRSGSNVLGGYYNAGDLLLIDADPQANFLFFGLCSPNKSLAFLDVSNNGFRGPGSAAVAHLIATNVTVTDLDISSNAFGRRGCATIAAVLARQQVITRLNITGNAIGDEGAASLAKALESNTSLLWLDMGKNAFGIPGTLALSEALAVNSTLCRLNISSTEAQGRGCRALCETLLTDNSTLTHLRMGDCHLMTGHKDLDKATVETLARLVKERVGLKILNITRNRMKSSDVGAVRAAALRLECRVVS